MEYEIREDCLTIFLDGELDHHALRTLALAVEEKIDLLLPKKLVLDMHAVRFMDSSGIALVIRSLRRMRELSGVLTLRAVPPAPMKIFTMAGISRHVGIEEGEKAV